MTYMSNQQVAGANVYIEFGWIWGVPGGEVGAMVHENFEEIVIHVGGDYANPEDLGADMEFGIGGVPYKVNNSYAVYLPRGMSHGPLKWYETRKPHVEMAIMIGAGTWNEGWGDSGLSPAGR
jgi:hypothetical protein